MAESRRMRRKYRTQTVAEGLLASLVVLAPVALGGTRTWLFVVAAALSGLALVAVSLGRSGEGLPVPRLTWALGGAVLLTLFTCLPLPSALAGLLSPRAVELATLPPGPAVPWVHLSLDWPASLVDAARLAALVGVFLSAAVLSRSDAATRRVALSLVVACLACACVAVAHVLVGAQAIYGVVPISEDLILPGPFVNPNHASSLGILATTAVVGLWRDASNKTWRSALVAAGAVTTIYTVASGSTGGIGGLIVAIALASSMGASSRHSGPQAIQWPVVSVLVLAGLSMLVALLLPERLDEVMEGPGGKGARWPRTLEMVRDHWATGVGRGAFAVAFEAYAPLRSMTFATHPENLVLHWIAEWGVPAGVAGLVLVVRELGAGLRASAAGDLGVLRTGLLAGVVMVFAHDMVDFGLEFLGVGVPTMAALGAVCAKTVGSERPSSRWGIALAGGLFGVAALAGTVGLPRLADTELEAGLAKHRGPAAPIVTYYREVRARHPADALVCLRAAEALLPKATGAERKSVLMAALPFVGRATELSARETVHLVAARAFVALGRRAQAVSELKSAAVCAPRLTATLDQALAMGLTGEEFAQLLARVADTYGEEGLDPETSAEAAAAALHYLRADLQQPGLAWKAARALLAEPSERLPVTESLAYSACTAAAEDAACYATRPVCSSPADPAAHGAFLLQVAERGPPGVEATAACRVEGLLNLDRREEAMEFLKRSVTRLPNSTSLRLLYGQQLIRESKHDLAAVVLEAAPAPREEDAVRRLVELRVRAYTLAGRLERASLETARAVETYSTWAWPLVIRARVLRESGDDQGARAALERALALARPSEKQAITEARQAVLEAAPVAPRP